MVAFKNFFEVPFDDPRIAIGTLKKFSEDNLARLTANPGPAGGPVANLVGPTGLVHLAYFGEITDVEVANAVRQGITKSVEQKEREFIEFVRHEEGNIKYIFGKESAAYQEFYPHGLNEYNRYTKENFEMLMTRFLAAATSNTHPNLPPTLAATVQAMHDDYQELRAAQLGKKGNAGTQRAERNAAREALEKQLWKNVLTISLAHLGDVDACMAYFDESILKSNPEEDEAEGGDTPPTP